MSEQSYKRTEKIIIILMLVGLAAMFQPWFRSVAAWFDIFAVDADFGRLYSREVAPMVFRYGFYILLLSTVAFTVLSHYSVEELNRALAEKGRLLTWLLIALPVIIGFTLLVNMANGFNLAAFWSVFAFVCAIAIWYWRRWGVVGYALISLGWMGMAVGGSAYFITAVFNLVLAIIIVALLWSRREKLR